MLDDGAGHGPSVKPVFWHRVLVDEGLYFGYHLVFVIALLEKLCYKEVDVFGEVCK